MDIKAFRGLSGTYNVRANERDRGAPRNIECLVQFLNNTQHKFIIDRRSKGQCLLDCVFKHLNLIETDFFGLKYFPQESHPSQGDNAISNSSHSNNNLPDKTQSLDSQEQSPLSNTSLASSSPTATINNSAPGNHNNNIVLPADIHTTATVNNINNIIATTTNYNAGAVNANNNYIQSNHLYINKSRQSSYNEDNNQKSSNNNNIIDENSISTAIEERWLDPTKSIRKQYKSNPPFKFYFRVKFYVSDPCKLADDTTRKHLYLQLRQDILNNRIIVPTCSAILLASYILQSEVGDFKRELLEEDYASNFRLLPNQSDDIKKKVIELHKQHKSLSSADAEYQFLEHAAKKLDCYGVEFYEAKDSSNTSVQIGVSSNGIVVFNDSTKTSQFSWAKIIKIMFKKKIFSIQLRRDDGKICDNFIEYNLLSNQACKSFWEECVAQHSFFRLHQPKSPPKKFFSFLNFGSKFQYNGKTEYQTMEESRKRSFSHFSRTPSKRYARRTIPIGRPSWSDPTGQESNKTTNGDENHQDGHEQRSAEQMNNLATKDTDMFDSSWMFSSLACGSTSAQLTADDCLPNGSSDQGSSAYRPKSLTLKSFMYIDESKNVLNHEHSHTKNFVTDAVMLNNCIEALNSNGHNDEESNHVSKKEFKRSESLRISNSIRGALMLTKKAGVSSSSQLARISESLRDKFSAGKYKYQRSVTTATTTESNNKPDDESEAHNESDDANEPGEPNLKIVKLSPGSDGKYGFKIRKVSLQQNLGTKVAKKFKKSRDRSIIIYDVSPSSPAATCEPRLYEGDQLITINEIPIQGMSESQVERLIKNIQHQRPPELTLKVNPKFNIERAITDSSENHTDANSRSSPVSTSSIPRRPKTLADSIKSIKKSLESKKPDLIEEFEKLSRKKEDEPLEESKLMENIDKNRYRDILPYDSTRVQLIDSMTGDYINASFVDMPVPSGLMNRYIATQGPLASTCDDFWQMVWEQNCSLIIMVTPLIEAGRIKCHKYWPEEKEEVRYGQILVRGVSEKSKAATIDRTIQLVDVKSGETRTTTQIQYKSWPDHEVPEDCSDFLKLVKRVREHRLTNPKDPIVVHCSAGIGRTGVLILMETAICIMEYDEPIDPIKILVEMRKQRAMLIQTSSQFQFVAGAICTVYDQKLYKKAIKHRKK